MLMARAVATLMGRIEKKSPTVPVMISIGKNAAQVVRVALTTGQKTSQTPSITAFLRGAPPSR